jgi:hypothetical protein
MPKPLPMTATEKTLVDRTIINQRTVYDEVVTVTKQIRKIRALRIQTRTPKTFQKLVGYGVRNPLPWALVQTINGMIAKGTPLFERLPLDPSDPTQRQLAAQLAATCYPLIQTYGNMHHQDYVYKACDQLTGDGIGIFKIRKQTLRDYPKNGPAVDASTKDWENYNEAVAQWIANPRSPNPFAISQIDSATFFQDRAEEPTYVVEYGYKPLAPTLAALGLRQRGSKVVPASEEELNALAVNNVPTGTVFSERMQPSGLGNNVLMSEVWTDDYCYVQVGGNIFKYENELGFIPYAWRNGMTTSIPDPALERVSTVFPFFALDPYINTVLTGLLTWGIMASMPTAVITTAANAGNLADSTQGNVDIPLGQMIRLAPGQDFDYKVPPSMGTEAVNVLNMMLSFYDRAGVTSMARGNIGTRTPGMTFSAALEAAGDMVGPIKSGLAGLLVDIVRMSWKACTNLNIPLNITGYSLAESGVRGERTRYQVTPQMIDNYYDLSCELQAYSDAELMSRGQYASLMIDKKIWSWERGAKYAGVQNPEAEREAIAQDTVLNSPEYMQLLIQGSLASDPVAAQAMTLAQTQAAAPAESLATGGDQHRPGMEAPVSGGGRSAGSPRNPTGPGHNGAVPQPR